MPTTKYEDDKIEVDEKEHKELAYLMIDIPLESL